MRAGRGLRIALRAGALAGLVGATGGAASPIDGTFPFVLRDETGFVETGLCIAAGIHRFGPDAWWRGAAVDPAGEVFQAVMTAIRNQDRDALMATMGPFADADQAEALIAQFAGSITLDAVPQAFEIDGMRIFRADIGYGGQRFGHGFVFEYGDTEGAGPWFHPGRLQGLALSLTRSWISAAAKADAPGADDACRLPDGPGVRRRVPVTDPDGGTFTLVLLGRPFDPDGALARTIDGMAEALRQADAEAFAAHVRPAERADFVAWIGAMSDTERARYLSDIADARPVYVIDAGPLAVVYRRLPGLHAPPLYFLRDATGRWGWSATLGDLDRLFPRIADALPE